ncbi:FtsK/SpoIIIE domain-containing protein [Stenoxybacter acetivorans]|uniref:FtsK/SpoIIIE domain-containing protein n=1 Tax=Stenoxybacter acetivorans TaxID=422441 RepID=UPI00055F9349|nr:FtsK/SpoIIIE domain-containing protein [Stenoxybacter acetivorans]
MYQVDAPESCYWNSEYARELLEMRLKSSIEAKEIRDELQRSGALPVFNNHFDWAMLCIAYCFAKDIALNKTQISNAPDTDGNEIPSLNTAFQEHHALWLAFLSDALFEFKCKDILNKEILCNKQDLVQYIQALWHSGALTLRKRWNAAKEFHPDSELKARQTFIRELADLSAENIKNRSGNSGSSVRDTSEQPESNPDYAKTLREAFDKIGTSAVLSCAFVTHGVRYDFYEAQFNSFVDFNKHHEPLCSQLGIAEKDLRITRQEGKPNCYRAAKLRAENQWQPFKETAFQAALDTYQHDGKTLPVLLGLDEYGKPVFEDFAAAPHVLVGGTTGSGKSVLIRTLIGSLLALNDEKQLNIAIMDVKQTDYARYANDAHVWKRKIIADKEEIKTSLAEIVAEMEQRDELRAKYQADKLAKIPAEHRPPYWVIVVDELADLLSIDKNIEDSLIRLAQRARASGIFLLLATQTPSSSVLSQPLRANIPTRIALKTQKSTESKIILDEIGAEDLAGKGDHLVKWFGSEIQLLHGYNI